MTERQTLDELDAAIFARGWLYELITVFASYQAGAPRRMVAEAYLGRILTPDGEVEFSGITPRQALAGVYALARQLHNNDPAAPRSSEA